MTITELRNRLTNLVSHITFYYNGYACGIDPLSRNLYEVWCGDDSFSVTSVDEVLSKELFNGRALKDIWGDVTDLEY
jgi:hypothetical protein